MPLSLHRLLSIGVWVGVGVEVCVCVCVFRRYFTGKGTRQVIGCFRPTDLRRKINGALRVARVLVLWLFVTYSSFAA